MFKHFAFFIEGDEVKWTYGLNLVDSGANEDEIEFQKTTINFIQTLQSIGRELYSEGVASIRLSTPSQESLLTASEIFIVNLSDQFFFIISDLETTSRLIRTKEIPFEVEQIITAVLVGQAAILYATLANQEGSTTKTDQLFRNILSLLEIDKKHDLSDLVEDGRCSLSPLDITELLLFHYMLRNYLENNVFGLSIEPWAIMVDKAGTDIPLRWQTPKDPYLLGNFLGAIYSYVQGLFGVRPAAITFGGHELIILQFYGGANYFLASSNPAKLFSNRNFISQLTKVPSKKINELKPEIKSFLINLILQNTKYDLTNQKFSSLLQRVSHLSEKSSINDLQEIPGLGAKSQKKLAKFNVKTVDDLLTLDVTKFSEDTKFVNKIKKWRTYVKEK